MKGFPKKTEKYQFQVGCIYFLNLKQNRSSKEEVEIICASTFDFGTPQAKEKFMENDNTRVLVLIMFYENRKSIV